MFVASFDQMSRRQFSALLVVGEDLGDVRAIDIFIEQHNGRRAIDRSGERTIVAVIGREQQTIDKVLRNLSI